MRKTIAQRGEGKAGCVFWVTILFSFIFIGWQVVPIKISSSDLEEFITRQAEMAGRASAEQIRDSVLARARDLNLPLKPADIRVEKANNRILIHCYYEVPISLLVYTYNWKIEHKIDRPVFIV